MGSVAIDWHEWFRSNIASRGSLFKFMYDSWVFSSPLYETVFWYLPPPRKIIDVGCGYGGSTILLACIGYDVTAVDIDEEMLAKATANASLFEKIGNTPVTFELADTFDLSKYYGKFD